MIDPRPLLEALAGKSLYLHRCGPRVLDDLLFCLPQGAEYIAIKVTDASSEPDHFLVFSSRRAQAWQAEPLSPREAQRQLKVWLHLRRPGEVRGSEGWAGLLDATPCGVGGWE